MKKIMLFTLLSFVILNLSPISIQADVKHNEVLTKIVKGFIPTNSLLVSPNKPLSNQPFLLYDFDKDEQKEIIITYEIKAKEQPSPSQFGALLLKKDKIGWQKIWETKTQGVGLDFSGLADITGDGTKEYLFGSTIGAAAGNKLEIFKWNDDSLKKIVDVPYFEIDLLKQNKKVGLAIWQWYIGESYLVDVLKWDGEKLVYDEELFFKYYPIIEKFYKEKFSKMDAWFYWYCLADAQIKANLFEEASKSIQKGIFLAEKLSMPEVVKDFNNLNERLEIKKKGTKAS